MKNWLDKYNDGGYIQPNNNDSNVSLPPGFKGWGYDNSPSGYNPAWNGPVAQKGIELNTKYIDSTFNANMDKRWVQRLYERNPEFYLEGQTKPSTHFMESGDGYVYPRVMEGADGQLKEVSREEGRSQGIKFPNDEIAQWFAKNYKKGTNVLKEYQMGGSLPGATGMMYARTSWLEPLEPKKAQRGKTLKRSSAEETRSNSSDRLAPIDNRFITEETIEQIKNNEIQRMLNKRSEVVPYTPQSKTKKAFEVALNPMTAARHLTTTGELPDNFSRGERNATDYAIDVINPVQYVNDAVNLIKGTATANLPQIGEGLLGSSFRIRS